MQVEELGSLETPIALTNTLNVGLVHDALVQYTLDRCRSEGLSPRSVNPVVGECNDGRLSDIALRPVRQRHVLEAIQSAGPEFLEGSVGAGTGTICYGLKGGIGSASRLVAIGGKTYTLGVLVQSNYGSTGDLTCGGKPLGQALLQKIAPTAVDAGSIMMIVGTDLPLTARQLRRVIRRCGVGLARLGSYTVSYTHLDVYKRQSPSRAIFKMPQPAAAISPTEAGRSPSRTRLTITLSWNRCKNRATIKMTIMLGSTREKVAKIAPGIPAVV